MASKKAGKRSAGSSVGKYLSLAHSKLKDFPSPRDLWMYGTERRIWRFLKLYVTPTIQSASVVNYRWNTLPPHGFFFLEPNAEDAHQNYPVFGAILVTTCPAYLFLGSASSAGKLWSLALSYPTSHVLRAVHSQEFTVFGVSSSQDIASTAGTTICYDTEPNSACQNGQPLSLQSRRPYHCLRSYDCFGGMSFLPISWKNVYANLSRWFAGLLHSFAAAAPQNEERSKSFHA
jgi:hypothetical protein